MLIRSTTLLFLLAAACSGDRGAASGVLRDSAGVTIAEHTAPVWADGPSWKIADSPTVSIGATTGDEPYQLFRVTDAVRAADGRIFVLNSASGEVRIFDAAGEFQARMGRSGSGPGEFRYPSELWLLQNDSVMVWDAPIGPQVVFTPEGALGRTRIVDRAALMALLGEGRATEDVRPLASGGLVVAAWTVATEGSEPEGELFRPALELVLIPPDLSHTTSLGDEGGIEQMFRSVGGRRRPVTTLFSPHYQIASGGSPVRIAVGNGNVYEIRVHDADGTLEQVIRRTTPPASITPDDREARMAEYLAFAESRGRLEETRRLLADLPDQEFFPAHGVLFMDDTGNVWVEEYRGPTHPTSRWTIYGEDGRMVGTFETARTLQFMQIGQDFILAVERDQDDVERVVAFPLTRTN